MKKPIFRRIIESYNTFCEGDGEHIIGMGIFWLATWISLIVFWCLYNSLWLTIGIIGTWLILTEVIYFQFVRSKHYKHEELISIKFGSIFYAFHILGLLFSLPYWIIRAIIEVLKSQGFKDNILPFVFALFIFLGIIGWFSLNIYLAEKVMPEKKKRGKRK